VKCNMSCRQHHHWRTIYNCNVIIVKLLNSFVKFFWLKTIFQHNWYWSSELFVCCWHLCNSRMHLLCKDYSVFIKKTNKRDKEIEVCMLGSSKLEMGQCTWREVKLIFATLSAAINKICVIPKLYNDYRLGFHCKLILYV